MYVLYACMYMICVGGTQDFGPKLYDLFTGQSLFFYVTYDPWPTMCLLSGHSQDCLLCLLNTAETKKRCVNVGVLEFIGLNCGGKTTIKDQEISNQISRWVAKLLQIIKLFDCTYSGNLKCSSRNWQEHS